MGITIVGLGPGNPRHLSREAWEVLSATQEVWLRTIHHPTVDGLPKHLTIRSFDHLYEQAEDFAAVYETIAAEILHLGERDEEVVFAVPGHPLVAESAVNLILQGAERNGLTVRIVAGISFVEPTLTALGLDTLEPSRRSPGLQLCDAMALAARHHPPLIPDLPALVGQVYSRSVASDLKLTLMNVYPDEHHVTLVHAAGTNAERVTTIPLYELDRQQVDHLTSLYIPPLPAGSSFESLQDIVAHLRGPEGCPWDREQTYETLCSSLIEEAYEAVAAVDGADLTGLCEELGDLLMVILMLVQIATEEGDFQISNVMTGIVAKMIHRHPHVWGDAVADDARQVLARWQALKQTEDDGSSALDGVPREFPALQQAQLYGSRAALVGFDWDDVSGVKEKILEEWNELEAAQTPEEKEAEFGDLLFAMVNWARHLELEAESALRRANQRFARRFRALEELARQQHLELGKMTIEEMEILWKQVKSA